MAKGLVRTQADLDIKARRGMPLGLKQLVAEAPKDHPLDRASASQVLPDCFHSDIHSFVERGAEDPRADGWEGDDPTAMLFGNSQGRPVGRSQ